jgi:hypothetical protein
MFATKTNKGLAKLDKLCRQSVAFFLRLDGAIVKDRMRVPKPIVMNEAAIARLQAPLMPTTSADKWCWQWSGGRTSMKDKPVPKNTYL